MGTLHRFGKVRVAMYGGEHGVAHFHVVGPDFQASLEIETLDILAGDIPPDILRAVREWAAENRQAIWTAWEGMNG